MSHHGGRFRRDGRIMNVAHTAIFGATVMYMGAAIFGYLTFAQGTKKDLLVNPTQGVDAV